MLIRPSVFRHSKLKFVFCLLSIIFIFSITHQWSRSIFHSNDAISVMQFDSPLDSTHENLTTKKTEVSKNEESPVGIEPSICDFNSYANLIMPATFDGSDIMLQSYEMSYNGSLNRFCSLFPHGSLYPKKQEMNMKTEDEKQRLRLNTLQKFCGSQSYLQNIHLMQSTDKSPEITLFTEYNTFECRVPKTGSSTRGAVFHPLFHKKPSGDNHLHPIFDPAVPKLRPTNFKMYPSFLAWFGFQFTRDPFERAVSGYFNKVIKENLLTGSKTRFNEYLRFLATNDTNNHHFDPQMSVCDPCKLPISFLGRTETLETDLDYLINNATKFYKRLNYHKYDSAKVGKSFQLKKTSYWKLESEKLDFEALVMFLWKYRLDYMAFGYNPHDSLRKYMDMVDLRR